MSPYFPYHTRPLTLTHTREETISESHRMGETSPLLTLSEVGRIFQVTPRTIQRWSKEGVLPVVRVGGTTRYRHDDIQTVIQDSIEISR